MESYWIGSVVGQFLKVGGVWAGFAMIAVAVALYLVRVYRESKHEEQQARTQELGALVAELREAREQTHVMMTNHIAHLASNQESFAAFQNAMIKNLEGLLRVQEETLVQTRIGFGKTNDAHIGMANQLSEIKGRLEAGDQ